MNKTIPMLLALAVTAAALFAFAPHPPAHAKKSLARKLELLSLAALLEDPGRPFTAGELERLQRALPTVKEDNPKLYKDRRQTELILLLYMILDEIEHVTRQGGDLSALAGKTRAEVARGFVERVYSSR